MALNHHDQEIVDLYHEGSTDEPPAKLDAAILLAARAALSAPSIPSTPARKVGWWKRFSVPMQFAVSFMLVVMLSVLVTREADVPELLNQEKAKSAAPAASSVNSSASVTTQAESVVVPPAALPQAKRAEISEMTAKAERAEKAPQQRKTNDIRADSAEALTLQSLASPPATESSTPQDSAEILPPLAAMPPARAKSARMVEKTPAAVAKESRAAPRSVKDWLDEMTVLLDQGKIPEARRLAEAFQKEYSNEVLPDQLKKRLAP